MPWQGVVGRRSAQQMTPAYLTAEGLAADRVCGSAPVCIPSSNGASCPVTIIKAGQKTAAGALSLSSLFIWQPHLE
jgi:hypothetical protein